MRLSFALILLCASLAGCIKEKPIRHAWTEEVILASERKIIVRRTVNGIDLGSELGGPGFWENTGMGLVIQHPKRHDNPPPWHFPYVPIVFDYDARSKEWFVVATFYSCQSYIALDRPRLPYIEYRARKGRWHVVPLSPHLIGRKANLLTGIHAGGEPALVTQEYKNEQDGQAGDHYRRVVSTWHSAC